VIYHKNNGLELCVVASLVLRMFVSVLASENFLSKSFLSTPVAPRLKTKPFVHVWGRTSRLYVIKNRKSFHLVRFLSRQWRLINFRMHRSDEISMFLSSFSNKLIKLEWNSLQLIILKTKHTWNNFFTRQEMQEI
jgi:hypothetical protein